MWTYLFIIGIVAGIVVGQTQYELEELPPLTAPAQTARGRIKYQDTMDGGKGMPSKTSYSMDKIRQMEDLEHDIDLESREGDDATFVDLSVPENEDRISSRTFLIQNE